MSADVRSSVRVSRALLALAFLATLAAGPALAAGSLIISEFRVRGPNGANDEFIEIYNDSGADHTVASISGTGYGIAASDGTTRCSIPNGTVIPSRGHWLCVNSVGYSLASYPSGNGTTATGDATYTTDIPDNAGIALFNNNTGGGSYVLANRFDAVGSTSEANTLYKEGSGYPALTPFSIDYSFHRDECGKGGSITTFGPCPISTPKDTDNNAADFVFVDTNGTSAGAGQRLGAPGPQNLASPIIGSTVAIDLLDSNVSADNPPNKVVDLTSDPPNNSTFGTISLRRRFVNNSGGNITRLRFRIIDLTTFPAPSGISDLRPRTSVAVVVAGITDAATCAATGAPATPPCTATVQGTTLEQPPSQPNGSGFNGSMSAGTVTLGTPLANGASINLQFLHGVQQTGNHKVAYVIEGLPRGGSTVFYYESVPPPPTVTSIVRANASPTGAASVDYNVTFSQSVTGVNAADFALTTTGAVAGASVTGVSGSGANYTVTVGTGTGDGTIRLDVVDDDTIRNASLTPLGGAGAGNGNFTTGEVYTIVHAVTSFSGPSGTGSGVVAASFTGGGAACTFTLSQLIGAPPGAPPIPPVGVPAVSFPHGLFTFALSGCTAGGAVNFTIVYPSALPVGTQYWKYGPTSGNASPHWYILPAVIAGNTATFSITDGGLGDDDLAANGAIVDQGGPGAPGPGAIVDVPALGPRALAGLAVLLAVASVLLLRRHVG